MSKTKRKLVQYYQDRDRHLEDALKLFQDNPFDHFTLSEVQVRALNYLPFNEVKKVVNMLVSAEEIFQTDRKKRGPGNRMERTWQVLKKYDIYQTQE